MKILDRSVPFPEDKMKGMSPDAIEFFRSCWDDAEDIEEFPQIAEERLGVKVTLHDNGRIEIRKREDI